MESNSNIDSWQILERIKSHFDFLFRRGFRFASVLFAGARDEQWQIILMEGDYLIQLNGHDERVGLALSRVSLCDEVGFFELYDLMRLMEMEENGSPIPDAPPLNALHDFAKIAGLLEKHIDDILVLMDRIHHAVSNGKVRAIDLRNARTF